MTAVWNHSQYPHLVADEPTHFQRIYQAIFDLALCLRNTGFVLRWTNEMESTSSRDVIPLQSSCSRSAGWNEELTGRGRPGYHAALHLNGEERAEVPLWSKHNWLRADRGADSGYARGVLSSLSPRMLRGWGDALKFSSHCFTARSWLEQVGGRGRNGNQRALNLFQDVFN